VVTLADGVKTAPRGLRRPGKGIAVKKQDDDFRTKIPSFLHAYLSHGIWHKQAKEVWLWLNGNSNTVIVDDITSAIRERRDWKDADET
jgi:hypothetical protein